jgi:hypothetical protein
MGSERRKVMGIGRFRETGKELNWAVGLNFVIVGWKCDELVIRLGSLGLGGTSELSAARVK